MNNRYYDLARKAFMGVGLVMICGGVTSCKDDYDLDDEGNYPSWLGSSIYEALKDPSSVESSGTSQLTGTFNNYVRLIEDLGEAETLGKTGSKTIFPANDEAFARFYASNSWGVSRYEDLTDDMKKRLFYSSVLDNALLVEMFSNVPVKVDNKTTILRGQALRHSSALNIINTIDHWTAANMPANNQFWKNYRNKGIYVVSDGTQPSIIHFTEEQMTANNISMSGDNSDFEVITGTKYNSSEHSAYMFRNKIINADVTCKNGYIHQMQDVLVPPGNMADVISNNPKSQLYSHMLDRFSAPYYSPTITRNYNDYAQGYGLALIDSVFEKRYFSERSQGSELATTPAGTTAEAKLLFDPGWNDYSEAGKSSIVNIGAMFVPTDEALWNFFKSGGEGEFLITQFGKKPNTLDNLRENLDSIPLENISKLINNMMNESFINSVPSKFDKVMDEASDPMGLTVGVINRTNDNKYDVHIANNGVIYMLNKMFAPPSLIAVSAPVSLNSNMRIMNEAVYDGQLHKVLNLNQNYYAYLLAMSANYAFFIPTDDAFTNNYYVDPCYLNEATPRVLKFSYTGKTPFIECEAFDYDKQTGAIGTTATKVELSYFKSLLIDILNYHTIVLGDNEKLGANKFYKTKHGGTICINFTPGDSTVVSGAQIANHLPANLTAIPASKVTQTYHQANGTAYAINRVIQAPMESVRGVLQNNSTNFSEFLALCTHPDMDLIMGFASDKLTQKNEATGKYNVTSYHPFVSGGLDYNVNYFKSYNYTVYAPDNTAMAKAYALGLPTWDDIKVIYDQYNAQYEAERDAGNISQEVIDARNKALAMVEEINTFVRYHFQDNSIYADNVISGGSYATACSDTLGISIPLSVNGGGGQFNVTDHNGQVITINGNDNTKLVNKMARDYVFNEKTSGATTTKTGLQTSSFAVIHQISSPLNPHSANRYDTMWNSPGARQQLINFRKLFETRLYKRYQ